jgi:hypothetical protein
MAAATVTPDPASVYTKCEVCSAVLRIPRDSFVSGRALAECPKCKAMLEAVVAESAADVAKVISVMSPPRDPRLVAKRLPPRPIPMASSSQVAAPPTALAPAAARTSSAIRGPADEAPGSSRAGRPPPAIPAAPARDIRAGSPPASAPTSAPPPAPVSSRRAVTAASCPRCGDVVTSVDSACGLCGQRLKASHRATART